MRPILVNLAILLCLLSSFAVGQLANRGDGHDHGHDHGYDHVYEHYKPEPSHTYQKRAVTGSKTFNCGGQGMTACPIMGREHYWECVDTENDLESCGGCMVSNSYTQPSDGVDCTTIPGISDVSCINGKCRVHRCMPDYVPNALKTSCIALPAEILFAQD